MFTLGERVAKDRDRLGLTQSKLAERLAKLSKQPKHATAKIGAEPVAIRTWLAKLESGKFRRDIGDAARALLADALEAVDVVAYRSLPVYTRTYTHEPERPAQFPFEELWVFSQSPLECRDEVYAQNIVERWIDENDRPDSPIVYFVPSDGTASELLEAFKKAVTVNTPEESRQAALTGLKRNLHIEEVTPDALALVPHFILRFVSPRRHAAVYDGFSEQAPTYSSTDRQWSQLPKEHLDRVKGLLWGAGMLDKDSRYRPAEPGTVRSVNGIKFIRFQTEW